MDDADVRRSLDRLLRQVRVCVWNPAGSRDSLFMSAYNNWARHSRFHSVNLFVLTMEVLGGADLPPASLANRLKRERDQLERLITAQGITRFFDRFARWVRESRRFVRAMNQYQSRMIEGAGTTVTILELTRDGSFMILGVCATFLTGGAASGPALATAQGATGAVLRTAASNFVLSQIQSGATRVGRQLAGEQLSTRETANDIINDAINQLSDAMVSAIIGKFLGPLLDDLGSFAQREVARGSIFRGVATDLTRSQIESAVQRTLDRMIGRQPTDIRNLLRDSQGARNNRATASSMANGLQQNRNYLRLLGDELRNET